MSVDELRRTLAEVLDAVAEARTYTEQAKELLEEGRHMIVAPQPPTEPWLPHQLAHALEQIETQCERFDGVAELLDRYQSRL